MRFSPGGFPVYRPGSLRPALLLHSHHHRAQPHIRGNHRHVRRSAFGEATEGWRTKEHLLHMRWAGWFLIVMFRALWPKAVRTAASKRFAGTASVKQAIWKRTSSRFGGSYRGGHCGGLKPVSTKISWNWSTVLCSLKLNDVITW